MSDDNQTDGLELSRRELLAAVTAAGGTGLGAGVGSTALFSDEEGFANDLLEAGEFDLKVDWQVDYYNGIDPDPETISISDTDGDDEPDLVDDPGPIVDLSDVKPGDVIEHTLSLHLFDNPGFFTMDGLLTADSDNGITEPEDQVDGALNSSDGTPDGDLDNHLQCVAWFDDGDGLPQEIWNTSYSQRDAFIEDLIDGNVSFDTSADEFLFQGTLASLMSTLSGGLLLDPSVTGHVANDYPDSYCFQPSTTEYIGILCWLPRDIPGVDDNIIQSDRLAYELGFDANQCRNNIDNNGRPVQRPTGGVQPLSFEVTEGYGTLDGGPVDLQSDVGFPEDMVTGVDTSSDPVQFVLDLPAELEKDAGDQWSLVFDADDDGTVDFRVVFDEFFYQEWDDEQGEWGPEQPVPGDIETAIINGIYVVGIPRDRLSDPFSFGGRVCYRDPPEVSGLGSDEDLCVSLTPDLVPRDELGPGTSDFEEVLLQETVVPSGACCKDGSCSKTTRENCDGDFHRDKDCHELCEVEITGTNRIVGPCDSDDCHKLEIELESDAGIDEWELFGFDCVKSPVKHSGNPDCPNSTTIETPCLADDTPIALRVSMCCGCVSESIKTVRWDREEDGLPADENADRSGVCCKDLGAKENDDTCADTGEGDRFENDCKAGERKVGGEDCDSICDVIVSDPFVVQPCLDDDNSDGEINDPVERDPSVDEDDDCGVLGFIVASKAGINEVEVQGECDNTVAGYKPPYPYKTDIGQCDQIAHFVTQGGIGPICFQEGTEVTVSVDLCCGCGDDDDDDNNRVEVTREVPPIVDDDSPPDESKAPCCEYDESEDEHSCSRKTLAKCDGDWKPGYVDCHELCEVEVTDTAQNPGPCAPNCSQLEIELESPAGIDEWELFGFGCEKNLVTDSGNPDCPNSTTITTPCLADGTPVVLRVSMCCGCESESIVTVRGNGGDLPADENADHSGLCCSHNNCVPTGTGNRPANGCFVPENKIGGEDCDSVCDVSVSGPIVVRACPDNDDGGDDADDCGILGFIAASKAGIKNIRVEGVCNHPVAGENPPYEHDPGCEQIVSFVTVDPGPKPTCFQEGTDVTVSMDLCCGCGDDDGDDNDRVERTREVPDIVDDDSPLGGGDSDQEAG